MTNFEFNTYSVSNQITINKGLTQIIGNTVTSTMKKDFSWIKLTDEIKVYSYGKVSNKKVLKFFTELGYTMTPADDNDEKSERYRYIAKK